MRGNERGGLGVVLDVESNITTETGALLASTHHFFFFLKPIEEIDQSGMAQPTQN